MTSTRANASPLFNAMRKVRDANGTRDALTSSARSHGIIVRVQHRWESLDRESLGLLALARGNDAAYRMSETAKKMQVKTGIDPALRAYASGVVALPPADAAQREVMPATAASGATRRPLSRTPEVVASVPADASARTPQSVSCAG
jgi:hypothetical protein